MTLLVVPTPYSERGSDERTVGLRALRGGDAVDSVPHQLTYVTRCRTHA